MSDDSDPVRREIEQLLAAFRRDLVQGSLTLYKERLASDAIILALDDPRIFKGKDSCLEYIRTTAQQVRLQQLDASIEELKLLGDVAIVLERATTQYEVRGHTYRDTARTTSVLVRQGGRWMLTHLHLESLAPNRIIDRNT